MPGVVGRRSPSTRVQQGGNSEEADVVTAWPSAYRPAVIQPLSLIQSPPRAIADRVRSLDSLSGDSRSIGGPQNSGFEAPHFLRGLG